MFQIHTRSFGDYYSKTHGYTSVEGFFVQHHAAHKLPVLITKTPPNCNSEGE